MMREAVPEEIVKHLITPPGVRCRESRGKHAVKLQWPSFCRSLRQQVLCELRKTRQWNFIRNYSFLTCWIITFLFSNHGPWLDTSWVSKPFLEGRGNACLSNSSSSPPSAEGFFTEQHRTVRCMNICRTLNQCFFFQDLNLPAELLSQPPWASWRSVSKVRI